MSICGFSELMDGANVKEDNVENTSYISRECIETTYKKNRNYFTCKETTKKPISKKLPTLGVKRRTTEEHDISKLIQKLKKLGINREGEEKLGIEEGIQSMNINKNDSDGIEEEGLILKPKVG